MLLNAVKPALLSAVKSVFPDGLVSGVAPRTPSALTSAVGDSFIQAQYVDPSFKRLTNPQNFMTWWGWLDAQRAIWVGNYGISGTRTDQWITAQLASAVADASKNVVLSTPVNDIGQSLVGYMASDGPHMGEMVTTANVAQVALDNITFICAALVAAGKTPIILNCIGATGFSAEQMTARNAYNTGLATYIASIKGVLIDARNAVTDGSLSAVNWKTDANLAPLGVPDGVHPSIIGSYYIGQLFPASTDLAYMPAQTILPVDSVGTFAPNIMANNLFTTTATVSSPTGFSGTGPGSITYTRAGGTSTTCVVSMEAATYGNRASHAISFNGVTNPTQFRMAQLASSFTTAPAAGDKLAAVAEVIIGAGGSQFYGPDLAWIQTISGVSTTYADGGNPTLGSMIDGAGLFPSFAQDTTLTMKTPTAPALAGAVDAASTWTIRAMGGGIGSATMKVGRCALYRVA